MQLGNIESTIRPKRSEICGPKLGNIPEGQRRGWREKLPKKPGQRGQQDTIDDRSSRQQEEDTGVPRSCSTILQRNLQAIIQYMREVTGKTTVSS